MKIMSKTDREQALAKGRGIVDAAKAAGRGLTPDEAATVREHLDAVDAWDARVASDAALVKSLDDLGGDTVQTGGEPNLGQKDPAAALVAGIRAKTPVAVRFESKAAISRAAVTGTPPAPGVEREPVQVPASPLGMTDLSGLLTRKVVDQPSQVYYQVSNVQGIAQVAELAPKPELSHAVAGKTIDLVKLAGYFRTSMEMDQDAPEIVRAILRQALLDLAGKENQLVLDAFAGAEGVAVATATQATLLDTLADVVGTAFARNGVGPEFLIASPADLANMRKLRDQSGRWLIDPFSDTAAGPMGLKVFPVPGMAAGTMWVGSRAAGTFFQHRAGVQVINGYAGNDLLENASSTVVEERVAAAVVQPAYLTKVTVTA